MICLSATTCQVVRLKFHFCKLHRNPDNLENAPERSQEEAQLQVLLLQNVGHVEGLAAQLLEEHQSTLYDQATDERPQKALQSFSGMYLQSVG